MKLGKIEKCDYILKENGGTLYETTIEKAKNLCKTIKGFKLKNDEKSNALLEVVDRLDSTLNGVDSELIRENDGVRNKVKNEVDDILGKFIF